MVRQIYPSLSILLPPLVVEEGAPCEKGEIVRPLARRYKGREIPATAPDRTETWIETVGKVFYELRADYWDDLILKDAPELDASKAEAKAPKTGRSPCSRRSG